MTDLKIQRVGAERVEDFEDLWAALYMHHRTVATPVPCAPWIDEGESWRRRRALYQRLFSMESGFALVAERDGDVVGYAAVEVFADADDTYDTGQPWAELQTLSVAPEYRGSHIGSELLSAVYDEVRPLGIRTMLIGVAEGNHGAMRFYRRHGYWPWVNLLLGPVPLTNEVATPRRALLHWLWTNRIGETPSMRSLRHLRSQLAPRSAFAGYRFPPEVIALAVRWYLRFGLSYRDVEELLAERGIEADHVSIYRWVQRFAPEFAEAARARQHVVGDRWHVERDVPEGRGDLAIPVPGHRPVRPGHRRLPLTSRDAQAARGFFERAIDRTRISPVEVTTDRYRVYPRVLDELVPAAFHGTEVHANNRIETDHGRLKARLRPMRGLKRDRTAWVIVAVHAFIQNLRRGFYDLGTDGPPAAAQLADAFAELALVI